MQSLYSARRKCTYRAQVADKDLALGVHALTGAINTISLFIECDVVKHLLGNGIECSELSS